MGPQKGVPPDGENGDLPCGRCPLRNPRSEAFSRVLNNLIKKNGLSAYRIAAISGVDAGNLSRYRAGKRNNPTSDTVFQLCAALMKSPDIERYDLDQLLYSAGFAPVFAVHDAK